jgi:2-polyprenyl-6-methoxyphenol hydroxylase-like FAD-dependent oxidoreductase
MPTSDKGGVVLIVGAGPTGLVLALWLTRLGVRVRIVDKAAQPGTTSRALAVHARILELYDQMGLADHVVEHGLKMEAVNLWVAGRKAGRAPFGDMGKGLSPFPYVMIFPQDEHERFLIERLEAAGVRVERPTEVLGFTDSGDRVSVRMRRADGTEETCEAAYVAGCDGAHSIVRETMDAGFPGGTYAHMFYVADVDAKGPVMNHELHGALDTSDFLAVFPLKDPRRARLIGTVRADAVQAHRELEWRDVSRNILERMRIEVGEVHWFSTYHVHHRVAHTFRKGRAFLLGDAAHIHSPVGGQGMNTGIGDAINLAWKLAAVMQGRGDAPLLDTYQAERRAFACRLVATTDRAFTFITNDGPIARFVRIHIAPRIIPRFFEIEFTRRLMFRTVSQIGVNYRGSALSAGTAGRIQGGDRLPWVALDENPGGFKDNFAPLKSMQWQIHVYGGGHTALPLLPTSLGMQRELHVFPWKPAMGEAGLVRDAVYLVRPDGYVGLVQPKVDMKAFLAHLGTTPAC